MWIAIAVAVVLLIYLLGKSSGPPRLEGPKPEPEEARLARIATSSTNRIHGRQILRQLRLVVVMNHTKKESAEREFLLEVEKLGGNGVINMQVRPHKGGYFSVQGDAVVLAPLESTAA